MNETTAERWLLQQMEGMPVVDAHEHLPPERLRLAEPVDALLFYRQYTRLVMYSAGLDEKTHLRMHDPEVPLDERFATLDRYRNLIAASAPARAARLALRRFYGEDDVTRENFHSITARMRSLYRPGLYRKVLQETCGISAVLQNADAMDYGDPLLRPVPSIVPEWGGFAEMAQRVISGEQGLCTIDEYLEGCTERMRSLAQQGAVGFKTAAHLYCRPDRSEAHAVFHRLTRGDASAAQTDVPNPLQNYITDRLLSAAEPIGLPVAVHTGVWSDFRQLDATEMIPYIMGHPGVRFDLFHMSIPSVREVGRMGANFGNVWLNMCWAHTIAPTMAANALDEWVDQVAANKVTAFGGDVRWCVEKTFGHLALAKEVVATVLGRRIDRGLLTPDQALYLVRRWFVENPAELYRLSLKSGT